MSMRRLSLVLALLCAGGLAGCAEDMLLPPVGGTVHACADRPLGELGWNAADADWGCSTAANLAAMVADPDDLLAGREAAPPKGDGALLAVERYQAGKPKTLPEQVGGPTSAPKAEGSQ
jgi:type IV pilus biogenesis protein CpaD/CtpE